MSQTKLYYASTDIIRNDADFEKLYLSASSERLIKTDKLHSADDKKLSLLAEHLLQLALKNEGITEYRISQGENGKPFLEGTDLFFNLSHSGKICICAVSDKEIGCDVEIIKEANMKVAKRFFSKEEYSTLEKLEGKDRDDAFFRIWTMKESFIKAVGTGLGMALDSFSVNLSASTPFLSYSPDERVFKLQEYNLIEGYKISLCSLDEGLAKVTEIKSI